MKGILVQNSDKHFNYKINSALRYLLVSEAGNRQFKYKTSEAFSLGSILGTLVKTHWLQV